MLTVKDLIYKYLIHREIENVFSMSGANIEDLLETIYQDSRIEVTIAKNEYNAIMMAIGSYLHSKKTPVVLTTSGGGLLNTLPTISEAFSSDIPLVLIAGQIPQDKEGTGTFQDNSGKMGSLDVEKIFGPVTEYCKKVKKEDDILKILEKAFESAELTKRPSVVFIPKDLFNKKVNLNISSIKKVKKIPNNNREYKLEDLKIQTSNNLVILGEDLNHLKDLSKVYELIEHFDSKVAVTSNAKGLYDHFSPRFVGVTGVMGHNKYFNYLKDVETVFLIGTNWTSFDRFGSEEILSGKNIIYI